MSRVLVVDDEASICWALREFLSDEGHAVDVASTAEEGLRIAGERAPDAVVLDVRLPGRDGLSALPQFRRDLGDTPIILITAFGDLDTAVRAIEGGVFEYLVKPLDLDHVSVVLQRALDRAAPNGAPESAKSPERTDETLIGRGPAMQELFKNIALVAPSDVPVLITGESGAGKELVARAIHRHSRRREGPFVPICVAALSPALVEAELFGHARGSFTGAVHDRKGLLELARGGTVLLDEIGDVAPAIQVKLLRAIEHREVTPVGDARPRATDIRIIAATNRPLAELIATGQFREDLYFRLSVFRIDAPPLRDRRDDIALLAEHFLAQCQPPESGLPTISPEAIEVLQSRSWPGNVRELRNTIEHASIVARGLPIRPEHLPREILPHEPGAGSLTEQIRSLVNTWTNQALRADPSGDGPRELHERLLELAEPPLLRAVLTECQGNRAAAALRLGIHRATLRQKLNKYGIE